MDIFYIQMIAGVAAALVIACVIISVVEREHCNRTEGGYNCHGENCEGCYKMIGGNVVYSYPQPMNAWGERPLVHWPKGAAKPTNREIKKYLKGIK